MFEQVLDVFEGCVTDVAGNLRSSCHRRGLKVWFGDETREHYEAQLVRLDGEPMLEIGFHSEHPTPRLNDEVLARITAHEEAWRAELGDDPVAGEFLGSSTWRRISEVWDPPDPDDVDAVIEIAARLADYVTALEPWRSHADEGSQA